MDLKQLLDFITPEIYQNLKSSVELGKWPNGVTLTSEQKETCMQAVLIYEGQHLPEAQRTGFLEKNSCSSEGGEPEKINIMDFKDN